MNRAYELGFIIPSNVTEADIPSVIETVRGWIENLGGTVTDENRWGRRRLAYPIDDYREGYYVFLQMEMPPSKVSELERNLLLSERIIRHLVVRLDD
mgnify:CR=1 FL=1